MCWASSHTRNTLFPDINTALKVGEHDTAIPSFFDRVEGEIDVETFVELALMGDPGLAVKSGMEVLRKMATIICPLTNRGVSDHSYRRGE